MSKMSALEAFKIKIVLQDMNEKLNFLESLKNNMGEEMAEMMSEEITKVMDEQRMIEMEYARLVEQRDQLKGITNKNQLEETKREIMRVAKDLKDSTKKLCRQLQKKPAVEGNQKQVQNHKKALVQTTTVVQEEMQGDLSFASFSRLIAEHKADSEKYDRLRDEERELTQEIQEKTAKYKKLQNDFSREQDENTKEMTELKKQKNEAQVEKDLHIQYLERRIQGKQSCEDRLHKKKETELEKQIEELRKTLLTERDVNSAVLGHLKERVALLTSKSKAQEAQRDAECARIDEEKKAITDRKNLARVEMDELSANIKKDQAARQKRDEANGNEAEEKEAKIRQKMSMEDAARYIQARWQWFQTEGKFLAKKGKKGRKGKKKKKK